VRGARTCPRAQEAVHLDERWLLVYLAREPAHASASAANAVATRTLRSRAPLKRPCWRRALSVLLNSATYVDWWWGHRLRNRVRNTATSSTFVTSSARSRPAACTSTAASRGPQVAARRRLCIMIHIAAPGSARLKLVSMSAQHSVLSAQTSQPRVWATIRETTAGRRCGQSPC
jgi:hypothetical protein